MNQLTENKTIQTSIAVIKQNENIVGLGLWNIGNELKYIRDNKTYQELEFSDFKEFCENHLEYSRRKAYELIEIREKYSSDGVHLSAQIGVKKLLALGKLDDEKREKFIDENDVSEMTVKEIEKKVKEEMQEKIKKIENENLLLKEAIQQKPKEKIKEVEKIPDDYEYYKKKSQDNERYSQQLNRTIKNVNNELDAANKRIKELKKYEQNAKEIENEIKKIEDYRKKKSELMSDIDDLSKANKMIKKVKEFYEKEMSAIAVLTLKDGTKEALKNDVRTIAEFADNWSYSIKNIFGLED